MSEETRVVEDREQQVIARVTEAQARLLLQAARAQGIRARTDLSDAHRGSALGEVVTEARSRVAQLIRDARGDIGGHVVGVGGVGTPVRNWQEGLSETGRAAIAAMTSYINSAERVFEVALEELATGEAPSTEASAERDAAAAELGSYEEAHSAPAVVAAARDRWSTIG